MSNIEDYLKKDKAERQRRSEVIKECIDFLESQGFEVYKQGTFDDEKERTRTYIPPFSESRHPKGLRGNWLTKGA